MSVSIDENGIIPYVTQQLQNPDFALRLAARCNLPCAEELLISKFNQHMSNRYYTEAAKIAATAPQGILRTPPTLQKFQTLQVQGNETTPLLFYFKNLLEQGTLNKYESIELCRPVLAHVIAIFYISRL